MGKASCIEKMTKIASVLLLPTAGKSEREIATSLIKSLQDLVKDVGLPTSISEYNIKPEYIDVLVENGVKQERLLSRSPKPLTEKDIREIYQNACAAELKSL